MYNIPNESLLSGVYYTCISIRLLPKFIFVYFIDKNEIFLVFLTKMNDLPEL